MSDATYKIDNATFHVTFRDHEGEMTGDCMWEVNRKQLAHVAASSEMDRDFFDGNEEVLEFDPECDDEDEEATIGSADALIVFAAAASQLPPAEYALDYYGSGYWFFHDMIHAEYDSGDGSSVYINEDSEMRALPMGAKLAAQHDVSISEILREVLKAQNEFKDRFGFDFDAIDSFLDSVTLTIA